MTSSESGFMSQLREATSNSGQFRRKLRRMLAFHPIEPLPGSCARWKEVRIGARNRRGSKPEMMRDAKEGR